MIRVHCPIVIYIRTIVFLIVFVAYTLDEKVKLLLLTKTKLLT